MLLEATELQFAYENTRASRASRAAARRPTIDGVSVAIDRGALVGILGPNGSGKTTLMRLLAGALTPSRGSVRLDGRALSACSRRELARAIAVVPQETQLAFDYRVLEVVLMGRFPHLGTFEMERPDDIRSALNALDATGTAGLADRAFSTLSGGEKQRVVIASALAQLDATSVGAGVSTSRAPRILLLDEPTASLDLKYQLEVAALARRLRETEDVTIVLTTHDLRWAESVCSRVVLLSAGRVLADGAPRDVLTSAAIAALYDIDIAAAAPLAAQ